MFHSFFGQNVPQNKFASPFLIISIFMAQYGPNSKEQTTSLKNQHKLPHIK